MSQVPVQIKKPCQVDLTKMATNEKGKFCTVCQATVVDFTKKTSEEISAYFLLHKYENTCGTFNRNIVSTGNRLDNFIAYLHTGKLKFFAVFIIGILILTGCRTRKTGTTFTGQVTRQLDEKTESIENLK